MKKALPKIFLAVAVGAGAFIVYAIIKAFAKGERELQNLFTAPARAAADAVAAVVEVRDKVVSTVANSTPVQGAEAVAALPSITTTETTNYLSSKDQAYAEYAPGGRIYNQILATKGQDAADASWAAVQANYAAEGDQVASDSSWWGLGNLFSY